MINVPAATGESECRLRKQRTPNIIRDDDRIEARRIHPRIVHSGYREAENRAAKKRLTAPRRFLNANQSATQAQVIATPTETATMFAAWR